jgi:hypothetical protein
MGVPEGSRDYVMNGYNSVLRRKAKWREQTSLRELMSDGVAQEPPTNGTALDEDDDYPDDCEMPWLLTPACVHKGQMRAGGSPSSGGRLTSSRDRERTGERGATA